MASAFFVLYLALLPSVSRWRGDERFYTDAVIGMTQSGNYFVPTYSDGTLRFKKPILAYWVVLLSYKALGISYLASRLPFLIAGTLVVGLTYYLGLIIVRRRAEALVASAVVASNLTVFHTAIRSTPDMLLTFFIMLSMVGFAKLIFTQSRSLIDYMAAYLGVSLSVATKGLYGLLPVVFVLAYVRFMRPRGTRLRDLLHGPVIAGTLPIAIGWFVWAAFHHGNMVFNDFWGDQVGERFSGSKWYVISNACTYLFSFFIQMMPWSGMALIPAHACLRGRFSWRVLHREETLFLVGWLVMLYGVFIFGNIQRTRYFLPAYPHLALLYSALLCAGFRHAATRYSLVKWFRCLIMCVFAWGLVLLVMGLNINPKLVLAGVIFAAFACVAIWSLDRWLPALALATFGLLIMLCLALTDYLVRPVFFVSPAPEITRKIMALEGLNSPVALKGISLNYVSQIRVLSEGKINPVDLDAFDERPDVRQYPLLVYSASDFEKGLYGRGTVVAHAYGISEWRSKDYWALLRPSCRDKIWGLRRQEYVIVRP